MSGSLKILQYNIRGIVSKETQQYKCPKLNKLLLSKQIDIVLLQEWCATAREEVSPSETNPENASQQNASRQSASPRFPVKYFPDFHVHFHSTECAILYHKDLCVTPLEPTNLPQQTHKTPSLWDHITHRHHGYNLFSV